MDKNKLLREIVTILNESVNDATKEFINKYRGQCEDALELSIEQFYDDYSPRMYKRQEGLLKAYKIHDDGTFEFDENLISGKHRVDNGYLYNLAFRLGWHGGALDGPGHPSPGTAYWRRPPVPGMIYLEDYDELVYANRWALWGQPAAKTTPILDMVDEKIAMFNFDKKFEKILLDIAKKKLNSLLGGVK